MRHWTPRNTLRWGDRERVDIDIGIATAWTTKELVRVEGPVPVSWNVLGRAQWDPVLLTIDTMFIVFTIGIGSSMEEVEYPVPLGVTGDETLQQILIPAQWLTVRVRGTAIAGVGPVTISMGAAPASYFPGLEESWQA
jgi:hypothetical protein